jgi:hypothetical protein
MVVVVRVGGPTRVDVEMGCRRVAETWERMTASRTSWGRALWDCLRWRGESQKAGTLWKAITKPEAAVCAWVIAGVTAQDCAREPFSRVITNGDRRGDTDVWRPMAERETDNRGVGVRDEPEWLRGSVLRGTERQWFPVQGGCTAVSLGVDRRNGMVRWDGSACIRNYQNLVANHGQLGGQHDAEEGCGRQDLSRWTERDNARCRYAVEGRTALDADDKQHGGRGMSGISCDSGRCRAGEGISKCGFQKKTWTYTITALG